MAQVTLALPALAQPKPSDLDQALRARVALSLIGSGMDTSPVGHWTQGAARVMQALVGGTLANELARQEQEKKAELIRNLTGLPGLSGSDATAPATSPASSPVAGNIDPQLKNLIVSKAAQYGLDPGFALTAARIESNFNPQAASPLSSARGLMQMTDSAWRRYGQGDVFDPDANVDAAMRMAVENRQIFRSRFGRDPTPFELYLMHQQGRGGAPALLANPDRNAIDVLTPLYGSRRLAEKAVLDNGGLPTDTAADFVARWQQKYSRFASALPAAAGVAAANQQQSATGADAAATGIAPGSVAPGGVAPSSMAQATAPASQAAAVVPQRAQTAIPADVAATIRRLFASGNEQAMALGLQLYQQYAKPTEYQFKEVDGRLFRTTPGGTLEEINIGAAPKTASIRLPSGEEVTATWNPSTGRYELPALSAAAPQSVAAAAAGAAAPPPAQTQPAQTQPATSATAPAGALAQSATPPGNIPLNLQEQAKEFAQARGKRLEAESAFRPLVSQTIGEIAKSYVALDRLDAIVNPDKPGWTNLLATAGASDTGQMVGRMFGSEAQSIRERINNLRPTLINAIRQATGMSARSLDSNVELQFYLQAASDPKRDIYSNLAALDVLDQTYGAKVGLKDVLPPQMYARVKQQTEVLKREAPAPDAEGFITIKPGVRIRQVD